jgi:hypothetical protein
LRDTQSRSDAWTAKGDIPIEKRMKVNQSSLVLLAGEENDDDWPAGPSDMHNAGIPNLGTANVFPIHGPGCPVAILTYNGIAKRNGKTVVSAPAADSLSNT